jgi:3-oxoacyl-[acyl-carrier protein] reductase
MMDLGIAGRTAVVCASSRGLGKACAFELAKAGCTLVINGRDKAALEETAHEIATATGTKVIPVLADVGAREGQAKILSAVPQVDILVNNNGGPPFRDFREVDRKAQLEGLINNMVSPVEMIQAVIDPMVERRFGRIVNVTSGSVKMPLAGLDLSSGARLGLTGFLAGVARSVAHANVTINFLLPGSFDTRRLNDGLAKAAAARGVGIEEIRAEDEAAIPAKRFGTPREFGKACAFLCSSHAGYITGQNLLIDGGAYPGVL